MTPVLHPIVWQLFHFRMVIYQNDWVAEYHQTGDKVVNCKKCVYDQDTDAIKQNILDTIFSYPYSEERSDIDEETPWQEDIFSSINTFKKSKNKKRRSRYDEDNYLLPDPETADDVKIGTLERNAKANQRQVGVWRAASFLLIGLLLISVTGIAYLFFEKVNAKGTTIK